MIESERSLPSVLRVVPDAVLVVDAAAGRVLDANRAAAELFGFDERSLRERHLALLLEGVDVDAIAIAEAALRPENFTRAVALASDGRLIPVMAGALKSGGETLLLFVRPEPAWSSAGAASKLTEARLQFALDSAGIGDWDLDLRTNQTRRSLQHDACFGYSTPRAEWSYETFLSHVHPADRERVDRVYKTALAGRGDYDVEFRAVWPDASVHWLWSKGRFYYDQEDPGVPVRAAGIQVDITQRKMIEEGMRLSALAMASTTDSIVIADALAPDYPIVYANEAFERVTGYNQAEILGRNCRLLQGACSGTAEVQEIRAALREGRPCRVTLLNYRKDGGEFWNLLTLSPLRDAEGVVTHYVGVQSDVTAAKRFEEELLRRATHDGLTQLPNQQLLEERLAAAVQRAEACNRIVAVAFVDIDRLKRINDSLGHAGGDVLIGTVADRMRAVVRAEDTVARYGGDEFIVVMPDLPDERAADVLIERLRMSISNTPVTIDGVEVIPSASIGIAMCPRDARKVGDIIRAADAAMYAAKASGRGSYRLFDRVTMGHPPDRLAMETQLRRALQEHHLFVEYQPIVDARTSRIIGLEALLRWNDPERGIIGPGAFVPLAEESGLIVPMGEWVLHEVARQIAQWREGELVPVPVYINVSVAQLRRYDFLDVFRSAVFEADIDPSLLGLEITESIVMDNAEVFLETLSAIRAVGARVSIDDFGTGFSSLSYLKRLALDTLKIDRSFVERVTEDRQQAAICRAIVTLAQSVGLTTVAEGVETAEQAAFLRAIGCDALQGYHFSRPVDAKAIATMLTSAA